MMDTEPVAGELPLWAPAAVVITDGEGHVIKVRLPQVAADSILVSTDHDDLVISGASASRRYCRRFLLRPPVKRERMQTMLRDGILEVRVPNPRVQRA